MENILTKKGRKESSVLIKTAAILKGEPEGVAE